MADGVAGEVRGDRERLGGDHWSWRAWSGLNRLSGWLPKVGGEAPDCARASGGGESLEQVVVTLEGKASHLLGWGLEKEDDGMRSWMCEG